MGIAGGNLALQPFELGTQEIALFVPTPSLQETVRSR
jgi:hypothetical protein